MKSKRAQAGFSMAEVLIAAGMFSVLMLGLAFFYRNHIKTGLRYVDFSQRQKSLVVALDQIQDVSKRTQSDSIFFEDSVICFQTTKGVRDDGSLEWSEELDLFWLQENSLRRRKFTKNEANSLGVTLDKLKPVVLSKEQLVKLRADNAGSGLVEDVTSFQISPGAKSESYPDIAATIKRPNGNTFVRSARLGVKP